MTSESDRQRLLQIAREAIVNHVEGTPRTAPASESAAPQPAAGAFVTIHHRGELRGCIGHLEANQPLPAVIRDCAIAACSADPRFPPVTAGELSGLEIEISLLGPLEPVTATEDIQVGRDGLVVEHGWQRGLLLPQVATERQWDRETFLAQTCHKAGLSPHAWKRGAKIWRFEAEVFGEGDGAGGAGRTGE
ncbi:MAG TPA: AmmeMemoRadiSam system protein A [Vicinamibacterales bacterium]|nr:AmmeMemoRadiSam system protein A [Vicinamibacterales bacterium]